MPSKPDERPTAQRWHEEPVLDIREGRYKWDYEALDSLCHLGWHYIRDIRFQGEIDRLIRHAPSGWDFPMKEVVEYRQSVSGSRISAVIMFAQTPGTIDQVIEKYAWYWDRLTELLGLDHSWLRTIEDLAMEWGLGQKFVPWGHGLMLQFVWHRYWSTERAKGNFIDGAGEGFYDDDLQLTIQPQLIVRREFPSGPPYPRPGMTFDQWKKDFAEWSNWYIQEAEMIFQEFRQLLPEVPEWRASSLEWQRNVQWLFERITPPYLKPQELAERDQFSADTVRRGIASAARLLKMRVSPGVRGRRTLRNVGW